jgi:hypothetical protein
LEASPCKKLVILSVCRQKGPKKKNVWFKLSSMQTGHQVFPFCSPGYIFPIVNLKGDVVNICFLPLVNSWAQERSQWPSAKAAFKPPLHY